MPINPNAIQVRASHDLSAADAGALEDVQRANETAPEPSQDTQPEVAASEPSLEAPTTPVDPEPDPVEQKRGYLRHDDYTRKSQATADLKRQLEQEKQQLDQKAAHLAQLEQLAQEAVAWRQLASDPDKFTEWHRQNTQPTAAPDDFATAAQVEAFVQARLTEERSRMREDVTALLVQTESAKHEAVFLEAIQDHAAALLAKHQELKVVDDVERLIIGDARARGPKTIQEFKQFMAEAADLRETRFKKRLEDAEKQAQIKFAQSNRSGILPPGGQIAAAQAPPKHHKLGSQEFDIELVRYVESLQERR